VVVVVLAVVVLAAVALAAVALAAVVLAAVADGMALKSWPSQWRAVALARMSFIDRSLARPAGAASVVTRQSTAKRIYRSWEAGDYRPLSVAIGKDSGSCPPAHLSLFSMAPH
jgi:hypothetical protein